MHISEQQLQKWAQQPEQNNVDLVQSVLHRVKNALKQHLPVKELISEFKLDSFHYEVYLEGAYANGTKIDFTDTPNIVVQLNSVFWADRMQLSEHENSQYSDLHAESEYKFQLFKEDVKKVLMKEFGEGKVQDSGTRLTVHTDETSFDVIPACQYRLYKKFISYDKEHFVEGIKFFNTEDDTSVIYYPKVEVRNCAAKDKDTDGKFKSTIRIYKHIRNILHKTGRIDKASVPSYFIESLLYNCSNQCFSGTYTHCMLQSLQYIFDALLSGRIVGFIGADEQELLVGEKMWPLEDLHTFIGLVADYYLQPENYSAANV